MAVPATVLSVAVPATVRAVGVSATVPAVGVPATVLAVGVPSTEVLVTLLGKLLPLLVATALLAVVIAAPPRPRLDLAVTQVAMILFGQSIDDDDATVHLRRRSLRAAHVPITYREFAAKTLLYAGINGVAAGVATIYVVWAMVLYLTLPVATVGAVVPPGYEVLVGAGLYELAALPAAETALAMAGAGVAVGVLVALATYWYRWYYPELVAAERERQIDISMPMTVSFIYALSRSGMAFQKVMEILADNRDVYGHAADEVNVAVRNIEVFGMDVLTAVKTMGRRSPSTKFREFSENLASVLQTGGSLSTFLHRQYEDYRDEAEAQQQRLLELLETLAEGYVTGGVAGPLFLITILVVVGITIDAVLALTALQIIVYVVLPLLNLAFVVYLSTVVDRLSLKDPTEGDVDIEMKPSGVRRHAQVAAERTPDRGDAGEYRRADGGYAEAGDATTPASSDDDDGHAGGRDVGPTPAAGDDDATASRPRANRERLAVYKQLRELQHRLGSPFKTVVRRPTALLWVTFPIAVFMIGIRIPGLLEDRVLTVAEFDDLLIQSTLFLTGTFAIAYEVHRRRVETIEAVIPDFLDRMASLNEAGMSVVDSFDRIRTTELGPLDDELDTVWTDIQWGIDIETALRRFEKRVRTKTVSRTVTLLTEAMKASGNLGVVLRIAADQAKADRRLKRERRQQMLTYLVVVYLAFFVFLFIIGVLNNMLLPSLPEASALPAPGQADQVSAPAIGNLAAVDREAFRIVFLHGALVQAVGSGFIAGQLSAGDVKAGAKHATIMTAIGYVAFLLFL